MANKRVRLGRVRYFMYFQLKRDYPNFSPGELLNYGLSLLFKQKKPQFVIPDKLERFIETNTALTYDDKYEPMISNAMNTYDVSYRVIMETAIQLIIDNIEDYESTHEPLRRKYPRVRLNLTDNEFNQVKLNVSSQGESLSSVVSDYLRNNFLGS